MNNRASYVTSVFSFLAGAAVGAGVALVVAPQAGRVTRQMMRRKLRASADTARQLKDRVVRRGEDVGAEAARRVTDAASALAGHGPREVQGPVNQPASA